MVSNDSVVDNVSQMYCRVVVSKRDVLCLFRESVYYNKDGVVGYVRSRVS
jgi:hypothetical protein